MRKRVCWLAIGVPFLLASCSTTYVLHWRESNKVLNVLDKPQETAEIPNSDGVALLYDRSQWVPIQMQQKDGSVWVYYQVILDNSRSSKIQINTDLIRLEGAQGHEAKAVFDKHEEVAGLESVNADTRYNLPLRFRLPKEMVNEFSGSRTPLKLVVPLHPSKRELRLSLWLWKV